MSKKHDVLDDENVSANNLELDRLNDSAESTATVTGAPETTQEADALLGTETLDEDGAPLPANEPAELTETEVPAEPNVAPILAEKQAKKAAASAEKKVKKEQKQEEKASKPNVGKMMPMKKKTLYILFAVWILALATFIAVAVSTCSTDGDKGGSPSVAPPASSGQSGSGSGSQNGGSNGSDNGSSEGEDGDWTGNY